MVKEKIKKIIKKYFPIKFLSFSRKIINFFIINLIILPYRLGIKKFNSYEYWINRYKKGGNSGKGSYEKMAHFKAEVLNNFVKKNEINSVIEFGSGDGNQLGFFMFPKYLGVDISPEMIYLCKN